MMNKYNKHYFERYAELTLYCVFPEWKSHFSKSERPDLQNRIDDVGIEVTSSTPPKIREIESFGAKLLGKKVSDNDEERFLGELFLTPERVAYAFSPTKGLVDTDASPQIISAISHKRSIWNGYTDYRIRGLYIFTATSFIDEVTLEKIEKSRDFAFFQLVIINAIDKIYYYKDGWKEKEFTDDELSDFKIKALEAEKEQY